MSIFFFFNDTATTEIYTLSLHDALPISVGATHGGGPLGRMHAAGGAPGRRWRALCGDRPRRRARGPLEANRPRGERGDRKSTRLNSSHLVISYAVFCLKKKNRPQLHLCV